MAPCRYGRSCSACIWWMRTPCHRVGVRLDGVDHRHRLTVGEGHDEVVAVGDVVEDVLRSAGPCGCHGRLVDRPHRCAPTAPDRRGPARRTLTCRGYAAEQRAKNSSKRWESIRMWRRPSSSVDLQRGAEEAVVADEEVRRAHDAAAPALGPVGEDPSASIRIGRSQARGRPAGGRARLASLMSSPRSKSASRTARLARSPTIRPAGVGVVHQIEGGEGRGREAARVEAAEEIRRDLAPQVLDLLGDMVRVERFAVHELERPGPNVEHEVVSVGCPTAMDEPPDPDVGVRAPDVCEHLDHSG